jgi:hypothetical protein
VEVVAVAAEFARRDCRVCLILSLWVHFFAFEVLLGWTDAVLFLF